MRTDVLATFSSSPLGVTASAAVSPVAGYIRVETQKPWAAFQRLVTLGYGDLFADLEAMAQEFSSPGWDGDGALPVNPDAIAQAGQLLRALPLGIARPTIGVEPDGQVTLEWRSSPRRILSVSVGAQGILHYAALIGTRRRYGTEDFFGEVPREILDLVRRVSRG